MGGRSDSFVGFCRLRMELYASQQKATVCFVTHLLQALPALPLFKALKQALQRFSSKQEQLVIRAGQVASGALRPD